MQLAPLGETLMSRGMISDGQLSQALILQKRHGGRLGDILVSEGSIGYHDLYKGVAEHYELPFVNLLKEPPDSRLFNGVGPDTFLRLRAIPWKREGGKVLIATAELSEEVIGWARRRFGEKAYMVITSPFDIRRAVESHFGRDMETDSRLSLWKRQPESSARVTMPARQKHVMFAGIAVMGAALVAFPVHAALAFMLFCHVIYAMTMIFKCMVFAAGARAATAWRWKELLASVNEHSLPVYTILVPMYKEASSLPGMLEALHLLDYPACKLDIKLVLEADDDETFAAAAELKPRYNFEIVRVPSSLPRTKPKACNYALRFARGELVTVFDADDRPERLQLKKAVIAFRTLPPDIVCLQARLNYYNADDNLLTRFFSLEYTILFHFMLYGLGRMGIPIPLGGTSNHIAIDRLKELGEWDPYNVTEDADLGMRLAARGLRTFMLDSYTMEEAPNRLLPWIRQRSRWIKGYMQTWLVHMRHPVRLYRTVGSDGFFGFQCFIGLPCFTFLTAPVVWALSLLWVGKVTQLHQIAFPDWMLTLAIANMAANFAIHWYLSGYCASLYRKHTASMIAAAILYPLYLVLHTIASYKGFWQLLVKPHLWEKTVHGLSRRIDTRSFQQEVIRTRS